MGASRWQLIQDAAAERGTPCPRFAHCNFIHIVDTSDPAKARAEQHIYFEQAMGAHRSHEHLEKSYFFGSIDEIVARLRDLAGGGCEYVVLGPTSDDPTQLDLLNRLVIPRSTRDRADAARVAHVELLPLGVVVLQQARSDCRCRELPVGCHQPDQHLGVAGPACVDQVQVLIQRHFLNVLVLVEVQHPIVVGVLPQPLDFTDQDLAS